jgi:hypothetical protein
VKASLIYSDQGQLSIRFRSIRLLDLSLLCIPNHRPCQHIVKDRVALDLWLHQRKHHTRSGIQILARTERFLYQSDMAFAEITIMETTRASHTLARETFGSPFGIPISCNSSTTLSNGHRSVIDQHAVACVRVALGISSDQSGCLERLLPINSFLRPCVKLSDVKIGSEKALSVGEHGNSFVLPSSQAERWPLRSSESYSQSVADSSDMLGLIEDGQREKGIFISYLSDERWCR